MKQLKDLLQNTGISKSVNHVKAWFGHAAAFIAAANNSDSRDIAICLQQFCCAFRNLSPGTPTLENIFEGAVGTVNFCESIVTTLMPKIFLSMAERVNAAVLQEQGWWKKEALAKFLPDVAKTDPSVFGKAASWELPADQLSCLKGMAECLLHSQVPLEEGLLKECELRYTKAVILQAATSFIHIKQQEPLRDGDGMEERFHVLLQALSEHIKTIYNAMLQLNKTTTKDDYDLISKSIADYVVDVIFVQNLRVFGNMVSACVGRIPAQLDNWLLSRNVTSIKSTMFDKTLHSQICGHLEVFSKIEAIYERLTKDLTSLLMLDRAHLGQIKTVNGHMKTLKSYSSSVHGLNVILNRMPGTKGKEKAALAREGLSCI